MTEMKYSVFSFPLPGSRIYIATKSGKDLFNTKCYTEDDMRLAFATAQNANEPVIIRIAYVQYKMESAKPIEVEYSGNEHLVLPRQEIDTTILGELPDQTTRINL